MEAARNCDLMVQLMNSVNLEVEPPPPLVMMEVDEFLVHQQGHDMKRPRMSPAVQQWNTNENVHPLQPTLSNLLEEPSPLGLKLRKSLSLLQFIQMQLAQNQTGMPAGSGEIITSDQEGKSSASSTDKLKASNFPVTLLKIGNWEYQARNEGDLVAKFFFAKHKLVWEVLDGALKSKIEIQWSDIMGLKAHCPENGYSYLTLVLGKQPLFFRETNPQPRKHTLWQTTSDFTNGQASLNRLHFLQCPQGTLSKHFEKLIQCDKHLNIFSRQPWIQLDSPYFGSSRSSALEPKSLIVDPVKSGKPSPGTGFLDATLPSMPSAVQPILFQIEPQDFGGKMLEQLTQESISVNSAMIVNPTDGFMNQPVDFQGAGTLGQFIDSAGLPPSMSKLDLMNYLYNMVGPVADSSSAEAAERKADIEQLAEALLNDSDFHLPLPTDDGSIMARVDSLCSLLRKDTVEGSNNFRENQHDALFNETSLGTNLNNGNPDDIFFDPTTTIGDGLPASGMEEARDNAAMQSQSDMDSFSDLLLDLPSITSLPEILISIFEDGEEGYYH